MKIFLCVCVSVCPVNVTSAPVARLHQTLHTSPWAREKPIVYVKIGKSEVGSRKKSDNRKISKNCKIQKVISNEIASDNEGTKGKPAAEGGTKVSAYLWLTTHQHSIF